MIKNGSKVPETLCNIATDSADSATVCVLAKDLVSHLFHGSASTAHNGAHHMLWLLRQADFYSNCLGPSMELNWATPSTSG